MTFEPGRTVLHYRIVDKLGEGGMGVVWKAVDTTLDRPVAIKVLPDTFSSDVERLARFEQEARLLASLNHSNIAAVYSVHEHEGARFLAMELVEGEDLSQRLKRGPMALDEALKIALQVVDALETAHDSGVIHRDLKPANIQLTPAGKVKVLDFGLAKAMAAATASGDPSLSPTMTSAGTIAGMILGTAGYMSPEQARGREVDRRADIWAFGSVLYEILTRRKAFEGDTISDTLASVLKVDPDWDALPADTPAAVRRVLRRCLTRDADKRLSHISGARAPLQETLDGTMDPTASEAPEPTVGAAVPATRARTLLPWALAGVLALVAAFFAWQATGPGDLPTEVMTLSAPFPDDLSMSSGQMGSLAFSPDGKTLAFVLSDRRTPQIYVRRLDSLHATPLDGTRGGATPFFSPDGQWIGFFAENGDLMKISVNGGSPITLTDSDGNNRGASWGTDDRIVFSPHFTQGLLQISGSGGQPTTLTTVNADAGERTHRWPQAVPGKDVVLFTVGTINSPENYDNSRIEAVRPSTGERVTVYEGASFARYVPTGHLLLAREGFLFAVRFDVDSLEISGNLTPVLENLAGVRSSGLSHVEISNTGVMAYLEGGQSSRRSRLVRMYRDGRVVPVMADLAGYAGVRVSPDRTQLAVGVEGDFTFDIWTYEFDREISTRLTFDGDNHQPVWSPDSQFVTFASVRNNARMSAYTKAADGSGSPEIVFSPAEHPNWGETRPRDWSSDGQFLVIEYSNENQTNLLALSQADGTEHLLIETPASEEDPAVSPDGRWLAYTSNESGQREVYVRPFPEAGGKWQISIAGGAQPRWSLDGREIFFRWDNSLFGVKVEMAGNRFKADRPVVILDELMSTTIDPDYDVMDEDSFIVVIEESGNTGPAGATVVVNWLQTLNDRVPD